LDLVFTGTETALHAYRRKASGWHSLVAGTVTGLIFSPWVNAPTKTLSLTYGLGLGICFGIVTALTSSVRNVTQDAYNRRYFVRDVRDAQQRRNEAEKLFGNEPKSHLQPPASHDQSIAPNISHSIDSQKNVTEKPQKN
jgi:hypothetical protein